VKIRTSHVMPPISCRTMDWAAWDGDTYDADCDERGYFSTSPVGWGPTEEAAIADLIEQINER